jgi:DUF1680 family protein
MLIACAACFSVCPVYADPPPLAVQPFDLAEVKLLDGPLKQKLETNRQYLLSLDEDRLLHVFRVNAGIASTAQPLGGWEAPDCELRGHFVGHYLSACALMYESTGDEKIRAKADRIIAGLAECQAKLNGGYLSAFPESFLDRLEAGKQVWAPYYTIHKIMAGLLDVYQAWGSPTALEIDKKMGHYFADRNAKLSDQQMKIVYRNEFGGMMEVAENLYAITHDDAFMQLAKKFDQASFFDPLARHHDDLTGIHANTHIPKVIGAARGYELTGSMRYHEIAEYFWDQVTSHRAFATGGTSTAEFWRAPPDEMANQLAPNAAESCCTYNMLKLTRHLFTWDPQPKFAEYYERAFLNSILPIQQPGTGMLEYYQYMEPNAVKVFSTPTDSFWCCVGTGVETFSKLSDSIYFHDDNSLYVNLFIPSELTWKQRDLVIRQETKFPEEGGTTLTIKASKPATLTLRLRIPGWAGDDAQVSINGTPLGVSASPGSYLAISRTWNDGDKIQLTVPMHIHLQSMPDDSSMVAVMYGPVVLAGDLGPQNAPVTRKNAQLMHDQRTSSLVPPLVFEGSDPLSAITPVQGKPLHFSATGSAGPVSLLPLYELFDEHYTVYWRLMSKDSDVYRNWQAEQSVAAAKADALAARIIDQVFPDDEESEKAHNQQGERTTAGEFEGHHWRHAPNGWFSYDLAVNPNGGNVLSCNYWGSDAGRVFDILIDGKKVFTESLGSKQPGKMMEVQYLLPSELTINKQKVTVRFEAHPGSNAGGVFGCAMLKP